MPGNEPGNNQILSHLTSSVQKIRSVYPVPTPFLKLKRQGRGRIECPHLWQTPESLQKLLQPRSFQLPPPSSPLMTHYK